MRFVSGALTSGDGALPRAAGQSPAPHDPPIPLQAAEKLASSLQAKNKRFVSGYRFSDTKTSSKSHAPLGAERRKAAQRKNKTHLASVSGGWDSGALTISNLSAHSFPQTQTDAPTRTKEF